MKTFIAVVLCLSLIPTAFASNSDGYKLKYDGGSITEVKVGADVWLRMGNNRINIVGKKENLLDIPVASVTEVSYGQDVHRRVGAAIGLAVVSLGVGALMLLAKSKKHYIGLTWDDNGKKGGVAFQADKSDYRGVLAGLEGITGKKAVDSDAMNVKN